MKALKPLLVLALLTSSIAYPKTPSFDIREVCSTSDSMDKLQGKLTYQQLEKAKANENWDVLIKYSALSVREDCFVPYRWKKLLEALIGAKRYDDAVVILYDMKKHEANISHFQMTTLDKRFLDSSQFKKSEIGKDFFKETQSINSMVAQAKKKLKSMDQALKPPALYVSKDNKCPFEYCKLGEWKTIKPVKLLEDIHSSKVIEEIPKGITVTALTGRVLKEPEPGVMLRNKRDLKAGEIIYILDYLGEGTMNVWHKGKAVNFLLDFYDIYEESVVNDSVGGPLKKIYPDKKFAEEWWVKIQTPSKVTGWVEVQGYGVGQFDGPDGSP